MPFSTICSSCKKSNEPILNKNTNVVYCGNCDEEIQSNHFMRMQLESLKQTTSAKPSQKSFSVKCPICSSFDRPKVIKDECICKKCGTKLNVTKPFILSLKEYLLTNKDD